MTAIMRGVFGLLVMIGLLGASSHASDVKTARKQLAAKAAGGPVLRVAGLVGESGLIGPEGGRTVLTAKAELPLGALVETGASGHLALAIAASGAIAPEQADVLFLGPNTRVRFAAAEVAAGATTEGAPVEAIVERGVYRALVRQAEADSAYALRIGQHRITLRGADLIGTLGPGKDDAGFLLQKGSLVIEVGARKVRLNRGMARMIEGGRIRGARPLPADQWTAAAERTAVPGIDLTQVKAATVKPSLEAPSSTAARGETAPPAQTSGGETTRETPAGETPTRDRPTRDRPDRVSFTDQKPGTTSKVIEEDYIYVRMKTSAGDIVLELDRARAPITVENFLSYMKTGFYEGTIFHRVMSNSMIQGGGYTTQWEKKETGPPIKCEAPNGLQNRRGAIAMARLTAPDTATSQFFINVRDNVWLDSPPRGPGYTVFGKVITGMDVVDAIKDAPVQQSRLNKAERFEPVEPVVIEKVELTEREAASE